MNWKDLARLVMEEHDKHGSSIVFVHSGLSAFYYPRFGVAPETGRGAGGKLTAKAIRRFLWERFRNARAPEAVARDVVVFTGAYDGEAWVGVGKFTLRCNDGRTTPATAGMGAERTVRSLNARPVCAGGPPASEGTTG